MLLVNKSELHLLSVLSVTGTERLLCRKSHCCWEGARLSHILMQEFTHASTPSSLGVHGRHGEEGKTGWRMGLSETSWSLLKVYLFWCHFSPFSSCCLHVFLYLRWGLSCLSLYPCYPYPPLFTHSPIILFISMTGPLTSLSISRTKDFAWVSPPLFVTVHVLFLHLQTPTFRPVFFL